MALKMRASVVVASRDRPDELRACLRSVLQAVSSEDEIIVVDSASADPEAVRSVALASGARYVRSQLGGSARARNLGVQLARGEFIAFTDDDARVDPGWLKALVGGFSNPAVAAVVGPVFELGKDPPALLLSFMGFDAASDSIGFNRLSPEWFERTRYGAVGSGANLAVRRSAFARHGLFRGCLGAGAPISGDENYYILTLIERGETVINEPTARVHHPQQPLERRRELYRSRIAYLSYVFLTRPQLRWRLIVKLVRGSKRQQAPRSKDQPSIMDLTFGLFGTPLLLLAAKRFDRVEIPAGSAIEPALHKVDTP